MQLVKQVYDLGQWVCIIDHLSPVKTLCTILYGFAYFLWYRYFYLFLKHAEPVLNIDSFIVNSSDEGEPTAPAPKNPHNLTFFLADIKPGHSIKQLHDQVINIANVTGSWEQLKHFRIR